MNKLILVGGLPGSGKSTLAETIWLGLVGTDYPEALIVAADDFFYVKPDEPLCSDAVRADPSLLRGADLLRFRAGRSLNYKDPGNDWTYQFDREVQAHAHTWCLEQVRNELARHSSTAVVVHNTFTQRWEMEPYFELARAFKARTTVTRLYDGGCSDEELAYRNAHGVPLEIIQLFRRNWELDWRNGDPTPPWERAPAPSPVETVDPFETPDE
jgi:hypothetical protein